MTSSETPGRAQMPFTAAGGPRRSGGIGGSLKIGIDVGGTFTDFVVAREG